MRVLKTLMVVVAIAISPVTYNRLVDYHLNTHIYNKVEPAMMNNQIYATTFQVNYKGLQYTLTNKHVCTDRMGAPMKFVRAGDFIREVLAISDKHDLCLLEPNLDLGSISLASYSEVGEEISIIGFPRGLPKTVRTGRILSLDVGYFPWIGTLGIYTPYYLISALGYPGNSGSPVVNRYGNLVGVVFAGIRGIHTEMSVVPLMYVRQFLMEANE